jgi:hypothetical protein
MAPAAIVGTLCEYADLGGPLLLDADREHGLTYDGSLVHIVKPELWG